MDANFKALKEEIQNEFIKRAQDAERKGRISDNMFYSESMKGYARGVEDFGYWVVNKLEEYELIR